MQTTIADLKKFYDSKAGRVVRRILRNRMREFWPDCQNMRVLGYGYAVPYLRGISDGAERFMAVMPSAQGAHCWPREASEKNLTCLSEEDALPFETESVDRVLMVHALEYATNINPNLSEVYRVLKNNGRLLIVVPNRSGFWAHSEWSPFGHGTPFSMSQLSFYTKEHHFVEERTAEALFMPPLQSSYFMKSANFFERMGQTVLPIVAGVHMLEASKQSLAGVRPSSGSKVAVRDAVPAT